MKIGIITFHASHNYGSMLQAWALQTYLQGRGHDVEIVNFRSAIQETIYHKPLSLARIDVSLASLKRLLLFPSSIKPLYKKWHLFEDFLHQELKLSKEYRSHAELMNGIHNYDLLICGSDQIWNTNAPDSGDAYYGNWFKGRKISYAASMGQCPEKCDVAYLKEQIKSFEKVSVREERTKAFLQDNDIVNNVSVVCDPTLLLDSRQYDDLAGDEPLIKGDYVFFYTPVGMPYEYFAIASEIGRKFGCRVITEKAYYPKDIKQYGNIEEHIPTGPKEFLNLIKYAKCVCGGSFHLQVFSILFKKNFYCINGDKDSRTNNLLSILGMNDRIISLDNPHIVDSSPIKGYDAIWGKLASYRVSSASLIDECIA